MFTPNTIFAKVDIAANSAKVDKGKASCIEKECFKLLTLELPER